MPPSEDGDHGQLDIHRLCFNAKRCTITHIENGGFAELLSE